MVHKTARAPASRDELVLVELVVGATFFNLASPRPSNGGFPNPERVRRRVS